MRNCHSHGFHFIASFFAETQVGMSGVCVIHSEARVLWTARYTPAMKLRLALLAIVTPIVAADPVTNSVGMKLVRIPAGEFIMGNCE